MKSFIRCVTMFVLFLALSGISAHATIINWNTWLSSTQGSIATYSPGGTVVFGYPSYTPISTFSDGIVVDNGPSSANGIMQITGGTSNLNTIHFGSPVLNPVMAIWSLGQAGLTSTFNFTNATPSFISGGPSLEYLGGPITVSGNTVSGDEGNGTIGFAGTFTEISWTNPDYEYWYGFNVGVPALVPEPGTVLLLGAGLVGVAIYTKRRKEQA